MPLQFACPHCGAETTVDDQYCGHAGPCFSCGKDITVPHAQAGAASTSGVTEPTRRRIPWAALAIVAVFGLLSAVVSVVLFFSVVLPGAATVRHTTHRKSCRANLVRIGQALQQYHDEHGSYPPAFLADDKGVPQHSWRVLILPQLGEHALYRQYHFHEPWDSPHNLTIASRMPAVFHCPADPDAALQNDTSYMVVVGPRTPFPPKGQTTKQNQALWDPLAETLLVVEVAGSGVGWTSPNDLQAEQLRLVVNPGRNAAKSISSHHPKGVNALFADGQVRWLSDMVPQELLSAALTRDGHEPFDWVQLEAE